MNRKITTAPCPCPHVVHRHLRRHCGPWMSEKRCTEPQGRDNHVTRRALRGTAKETKSTVGIRRDCPRGTGDLTALTLKLWGGPPVSLTSAFCSDRFSILTRALALLDTFSITRSKNPGFPRHLGELCQHRQILPNDLKYTYTRPFPPAALLSRASGGRFLKDAGY